MNKKILGIVVVLMTVVILTTSLVGMASAKKPTVVNGKPTFVSGTQMVTGYDPASATDVFKGKSVNHLATTTLFVTWSGDIAGDTEYESVMMIHGLDPWAGCPINVHERIYFEDVTVLGNSGSLTLQVCANLGRGVDAGFRWTIIEGTGELANLHGNGLYWLNDITGVYDYEGCVHFDP